MTLQQAATAVRGIDVAMLRQVERPDRMYRRAHRDVVDHVRLRREETSLDANSSREMKFPVFPKNRVPIEAESTASRHASGNRRPSAKSAKKPDCNER